jgi:hypothetical protein
LGRAYPEDCQVVGVPFFIFRWVADSSFGSPFEHGRSSRRLGFSLPGLAEDWQTKAHPNKGAWVDPRPSGPSLLCKSKKGMFERLVDVLSGQSMIKFDDE